MENMVPEEDELFSFEFGAIKTIPRQSLTRNNDQEKDGNV
jgi:hypothetical protein